MILYSSIFSHTKSLCYLELIYDNCLQLLENHLSCCSLGRLALVYALLIHATGWKHREFTFVLLEDGSVVLRYSRDVHDVSDSFVRTMAGYLSCCMRIHSGKLLVVRLSSEKRQIVFTNG